MKKLIIFLALILLVTTASAISVDGSKYMGNISAGSSDIHRFAVGIGPGDAPVSVTITTHPFGQSRDMSYTMLNYANKYSSTGIITIDKPEFTLEPGKKVSVNATISIPSDAGAGGRYVIIYVKASPVNSSSTYATAVTIPVLVTIDKSTLVESVDVVGMSVNGNVVSTRIKNTGNIHFYGLNEDIQLFDKTTGVFVTGTRTKPSIYTFLPESEAVINITLDRAVDTSKYNVVSIVYKDTTKLTEKVMTDTTPSPESATAETPLGAIVVIISLISALLIAFRYQKDN